jgi:hypothetical protein
VVFKNGAWDAPIMRRRMMYLGCIVLLLIINRAENRSKYLRLMVNPKLIGNPTINQGKNF